MQSPAHTAEGLSGPLFGAYALPTFKFQPRHESVDWRRISALDVDRVARELDVATLQENIAGVTFCNLDREACSRCGQPVDPALLKVLRLAQLIIEYLLHCQDCLSASVAQLEARLQASLGQQERGQQELGRQADELKGVREESRRRRKMISTLQQLLLQTGAHSYQMCHLCDKTFMNATFLRGHIQRRHGGMAEGGKQKKQEQPVEEVLEELQAKLKWTQGELEAQREAERQRMLQEAEITRQREIEAKKEFDEWKEKERAKLYGEIDKLKKLFWDEFKSVANHNSTLEEKLKALQSHSVMGSNLGSLRDEESEERLRQAQELRAMREKIEVQKTEWKRKLKELQEEHAAQKRELQEENERLQASLSQDQRTAAAQSQRQINALRTQLQEQARLIASQEEMIQTMSLRKVEGICEGLKAVDTEENSSEEELEDSQDGQQKVLAALRRNPTLLKQFRPVLEDTLEEKLESMGIKRDAKGIPVQTLRHLESLLRSQREQKAGRFSEFLSLREKLIKEATSRVKERQRQGALGSQPDGKAPVKSQQNPLVTKEVQPKARTLNVASPSKPVEPPVTSLQSRGSHGPGLAQVPTPTPRLAVRGPSGTTSSPGLGLSSTPPFSSEEDSEGHSVQQTSRQPPKVPSRMGPRPEDDSDWSDTGTSEGSAPFPGKGSGGPASSGTLVQSMVKNLEKQLEAPAKKPAGGVSLFLTPNTGPQRPAAPGRKPQLSDDESDLEVSSLEDLPQDLDQRGKPRPLSHSKLPEKFGTSAWSPGQPRVPGW
ncbi:zinc finger protein DZIP1L isoform X1 [Pteropus alecto]|uniref:Zinc finger protein DZIP1L n=1 Tax=Pteropus alecto TaxID=9402 RepID=L5KZ75_PTEAL|nr:zinc finger protein DZIP1L isoform X1 [Pteropus alecto]XP_015441306.1 zinc finger protein DZIP1L isoform X1 [Pteropus alecto]XP_015441307.1 zinc finger protein DZIP1L isoform X1 [Pteropus alecto]XP_015441308.1 zinc finger protein DZIP1L isoform X1 [Pteropus alecto]XP_015441309.1 zinc finger protein DZIP1L isoform X1 [Pteropus alecto]XP_024899387.1 zinc finger protein DZIP1L isoform X1 [Pteropus alecto]XP_024899388.1 zinc finger protein DZIP1L isoform X1 [Pteropus alecto]XP_024899389.1 zin